MSSWSRIKQSKLKSYLHQFKRCYLLIPHYSSLNYTTSNSSTYAFAKNHFVNPKRPTEFCNYPRFFAAPVQAKPKQEEKDKSGPRLNEKITANFVRLVLPEGGHNIVSRNEALQRARKLKLDLVEVQRTADPPVCKIMDFHREKYKQQVKEKDRSKSKSEVTLRKGDCKEVRFSAKTEQKDLQMKADTVKRLMERGYRVKCMVMGTEDQDLGGLLSRLTELIEDVSVVESGPRAEKRQAYAIVRHVKFGPSKKGLAKKASKLMGAASNEVQKGVTAPPTIEPCIPGQAPLQFEEDLTSAGSGFETDDESISDDVDPRPDKSIGEKRTTWSVLDTSEDFDKLFDLSDEKGVTSHSTVGEMATAPEKASSLLSTPPKPLLDLENSYKRSEPRDNNPRAAMENRGRRAGDSVRLERQFPSPGKLPLLDLNVSSADPSYGTFSTVPKASAGHNGVAGEIRRNSEGKSFDSTGPVKLESGFQFRNLNRPPNEDPKHEQPHSGASKSAAPSYGIFSEHGKQSTTGEINREKKGNPLDSERKANPGGLAASGSPASNSEGSQRPGGWGIFSRENQA